MISFAYIVELPVTGHFPVRSSVHFRIFFYGGRVVRMRFREVIVGECFVPSLQSCWLHDRLSTGGPSSFCSEHSFPFPWGWGSTHHLLRYCIPPPQSLVHSDHSPQLLYPPSTSKINNVHTSEKCTLMRRSRWRRKNHQKPANLNDVDV